jgi:hypothetical protein
MKKSARVTLTVVAAVGCAARAQQAPNPCEPANFNEKACQVAVKGHVYAAAAPGYRSITRNIPTITASPRLTRLPVES